MSKLIKEIKKGASSAVRTAKGALRGDVDDILSLGTLGGSKRLEELGKAIHKPFKAPDAPPIPGVQGAITQEAAPDVNLATTEASRRTTGQAVGTRKLRIPLGGLR